MGQNSVEVDHDFLYYYIFLMETESVSEVSWPHDMEATEKT